MKLRASIITLALLGTFAFATSASAAVRYAAPGTPGGDLATCNPVACSLDDALKPGYMDNGDQIILAKGNYSDSKQRTLAGDLNIHGIGKPEETKINVTTAGDYWLMFSDERLTISKLEIDGSSDSIPLYVEAGTANRVIVRNTAGDACGLRYGWITDSLCHTSSPGHSAVKSSPDGGYNAPVLAGVTAVASSPLGGYGINLTAYDATIDFVGFGTIASGATADIKTEFLSSLPGTNSLHVNMVVSNYNSTDYAAGTTLQTSELSSNQSAEPKFVNAAAGDFHETSCSPTIGAAVTSGYSEGTDLEGVDRSSGAIDIGAYEFTGAPPVSCATVTPPPAAGPTPDTKKPKLTITKKPKKTVRSLKVKVSFTSNEAGSSFMCKLDKGKFKKCESPYKRTVKPGKHKLKIYAIDAAGNVSSTREIGWLANKKK